MTIEIDRILILNGTCHFESHRQPIAFTGDQDADSLLNGLETTPHAFVIACVMDRQIKAELAWLIPHRLCQKLGNFDSGTLRQLDLDKVTDLMTRPEPLQRLPNEMAVNLTSCIDLIQDKYEGDVSGIWTDEPSSATEVGARPV